MKPTCWAWRALRPFARLSSIKYQKTGQRHAWTLRRGFKLLGCLEEGPPTVQKTLLEVLTGLNRGVLVGITYAEGSQEPSGGSPGLMAADSPGPERPHSETPTYVNIPVSPLSRPQLHYMGLEFPGPSAGVRGASASRYAQIDITATETAHRVGALHAQTREERLSELEERRRGAPR